MLDTMVRTCHRRYTRGLVLTLNGIRKHNWCMDSIFFTISKKYGFEFPKADDFDMILKFTTMLHNHGVIATAICDDHIDFGLLIEKDVNIFPAIVHIYGPYLEIINNYFTAVAVHIQQTHRGLTDEQKLQSLNMAMKDIQMNL